jgi:hypothetical protein
MGCLDDQQAMAGAVASRSQYHRGQKYSVQARRKQTVSLPGSAKQSANSFQGAVGGHLMLRVGLCPHI